MGINSGVQYIRLLTDMIGPFVTSQVLLFERNSWEKFNEHQIANYLREFVTDFCRDYNGSANATDVIKGLIRTAQTNRLQAAVEGALPYSQRTIDSVLAHFINVIAKQHCNVSFTIRPEDLPKPLG